jgi:glycosyltransferase involved in cell wall biosynthesis
MNIKPKIAVFGVKGFPGFGGASRANEEIVNILKDRYEYTIYSVSTHAIENNNNKGYTQIIFKGFNGKRLNTFIYYLKSLIHALLFGSYDIVQVNHTSSGFLIPLLRMRFKVVSTARGIIPYDDNKWNIIDKKLFDISAHLFFKFSNIVISVSEPHIKKFKAYTKKEIQYIPNGIHIDNNRQLINERDSFLLFAASRIISLKGAHTLVDALNIMNYKGKTIIIGGREHTPDYIDKLIFSSRDRDTQFVGLIKEKELLYEKIRNAKLFIFPSFNEGMSNMLLEVASLKTPLICSDILENKAIFNDIEVLYFKTGDSENLALKIEWAISNYSLMQQKAENAFLKLKRDYQWSDISEKYSKAYKSLIDK